MAQSSYSIVSEDDDKLVIELRAGANIRTLAPELNALSRRKGKPVIFDFSGFEAVVDENTTAEDVIEQNRAAREAYDNSPAGRQRKAAGRAREQGHQKRADELVRNLPEVLKKGDDAFVDWLGEISALGEKRHVTIDTGPLGRILRDSGRDPDVPLDDDYATREELVAKLAALAITDFENGDTPYPHAMRNLCTKYAMLPSKQERAADTAAGEPHDDTRHDGAGREALDRVRKKAARLLRIKKP